MTVKEYVEIITKEPFNRTVGQAYHTLRWDTDPNRKLMHIGPTVVPVPPPPEPKVKAKKEPKEAKDPAAKNSAENSEHNVHQDSITAALHHFSGEPTGTGILKPLADPAGSFTSKRQVF